MLAVEALRDMRVMFATPCYGGQVTMHYACSLVALTRASQEMGLPCIMQMWAESLVPRARNTLAAQFLADPQLTHLFFIDADLAFRPGDVHRLLLHDRDVVCGVYPIKDLAKPQKFPWFPEIRNGTIGAPDADGLIEAEVAPTGFMCIKRRVFEDNLCARAKAYYVDGARQYDFFRCGVYEPTSPEYLSEDYWFCKDVRWSGGQVWVDPACEFKHIGQHVFEGKLGDSL